MKTRSELNTAGIEDHSSHRARSLRSAKLTAGVTILLFTLVNGEAAVEQPDFCRRTAQAVLTSCRNGAQSDYWLALAKCENLADPAAREECQKQASANLNDARRTCEEQDDARLAACERLGGAPYNPVIDPSNFVARVDNPYFPLRPGTTFIYEGRTAEGLEHDEFAVTHNTRAILGVTCVEVHDTVTVDGELTEDTLDWFAQDKDGNVWYLGEDTKELDNGQVVSTEGSWEAGVGGAEAGIIMWADPAAHIGEEYRQEFSQGVAEDFGKVVAVDQAVDVPFGSLTGCLKTEDRSALEPGVLENKYYCPQIGIALEVTFQGGSDRNELVDVIGP